MTRRELHKKLTRSARKWVREVWQAAVSTAAELESLSPVTAPLGVRLVESYAAREQAGEETQRGLRIAVVAGYTSRVVLVEPTQQPTPRPSAFGLGARPDVERIGGDPAAIKRLADPVRSIATEQFETVMTLPQEVWSGYVATAANKLQRQLRGELTWRELGRDRIERMLRYGYVLRCLDEVIDAEPVVRDVDARPVEASGHAVATDGTAAPADAQAAPANAQAAPANAQAAPANAQAAPADE
jgi:hypothetical protein